MNGERAAKWLEEAFPGAARARGISKEAREGNEHHRVSEWLRELALDWDYAEPVGRVVRMKRPTPIAAS
jgi:hypothetical protein